MTDGQARARSLIQDFIAKAQAHDAVRHPYLTRLADGSLPDPEVSLRQFAYQYGHVIRHAPRAVRAIIRHLDDPAHKAILERYLAAQNGTGSWTAQAHPYADLYRSFEAVIGIGTSYRRATPVLRESHDCASRLVRLCADPNPAPGIAALTFGIEAVLPGLYNPVIEALHQHTDLVPEQLTVFTVALEQAPLRLEALLRIAADLIEVPGNETQMIGAMEAMLTVRARLWRALLMEALTGVAERQAG